MYNIYIYIYFNPLIVNNCIEKYPEGKIVDKLEEPRMNTRSLQN
jgi:hypothetical protein